MCGFWNPSQPLSPHIILTISMFPSGTIDSPCWLSSNSEYPPHSCVFCPQIALFDPRNMSSCSLMIGSPLNCHHTETEYPACVVIIAPSYWLNRCINVATIDIPIANNENSQPILKMLTTMLT